MVWPGPTRRPIRAAGSVAILALTLVSCRSDGRQLRDPVFDPPAPPVTDVDSTPPTAGSTFLTIPSLPERTAEPVDDAMSESRTIEIEQLFSPANATAEMTGIGALVTDPVTVDDQPADVLSFEVEPDRRFVVQVWIDDEGPHTVCVAEACARVYTLAADAESPEEVTAKIEAALQLATEYLDFPTEFPDWQSRIAGALSGTGGTTDPDTKTVTIYRNRGRTIDDFVRTILHEFGHVADFERLDDEGRATYLELRGVDPSTTWRDGTTHRLDAWGRQPSEDFAEVMVALWSGGRWLPRTDQLAPAPSADALAQIELLIAP